MSGSGEKWRTKFGAKDGDIEGKRGVGLEIGRKSGKTQAEQKGRERAMSYHQPYLQLGSA